MTEPSTMQHPRPHLSITDLMTKCAAEDYAHFDVRITRDEFDRCGKGDQVVVYDKKTGEDVSEPLIDFFAEALATRLHEAYPDTRCRLHRPYERGKRLRWDMLAGCTCTLVFESRLRAALNVVKLNQIDITMIRIRLAQEQLQRERSR